MSVRAYQQTAQRSELPRDVEYRLMGEVTRALMEAASTDPKDFAKRIEALDWNRRVWAALANDCTMPTNTLPPAVRAQIVSLSLWVNRHTSAVMRREEQIEPLIDINRVIMQGLAANGARAA